MGNSEGINKKVIVVILIIVLLLGTIMMINIFNKSDDTTKDNNENNISNTTNVKDNNAIDINSIENTNSIEDNEATIENGNTEDGLIVVTNQFSSSEQENKNGLIKVNVNGYKGDSYILSNNTDNPNINKKPVTIIDNQTDKTAPNINVSYSKQNLTNENIIVTLRFNEQVRDVTNGYILAEDKMSAYKEYKENTDIKRIVVDYIAGQTDKFFLKECASNLDEHFV